MIIELYVCPTPGCGSYFGHENMPDLTAKTQHTHGINFEVIPEDRWHSRAECPLCRARGQRVERVRIQINLEGAPENLVAAVP